jgi:ABC-2 type transport system permease protein
MGENGAMMRAFDVAFKDLKSTLRTPMALVFMFVAPLFITGLLYFAFGGFGGGGQEPALPEISAVVVNLDQPPPAAGDLAVGEMLVEFLQSKELASIQVSVAPDALSARAAVDRQEAGVAVIIPADLTASVITPNQKATITVYQDPVLTIGPSVVQEVVSQFLARFAGAKVATEVVREQWQARDLAVTPAVLEDVARAYSMWLDRTGHQLTEDASALIDWQSPTPGQGDQSWAEAVIGPIMASMTIFFIFFIGANTAESIIREDEAGTLSRLFTTPTSRATILTGKYAYVFLTLVIQLGILLLVGRLIFDISWGPFGTAALAALGLVVAAAGFGVLLMSFIENTRQTGPVMGGVLTLTGMLGGLFTSGIPNLPEIFGTVSLVTPQGWALRAWQVALSGGRLVEVLPAVTVLIAMGLVFMTVGVLVFRRRFA